MEPATILAGVIAASSLAAVVLRTLGGFRSGGPWNPRFFPEGAVLLAGIVVAVTFGAVRLAEAATPPPLVRRAIAAEPHPGAGLGASSLLGPHVVVRGDTLWDIAAAVLRKRQGTAPTSREIDAYWRRIYDLNRETIGSDPNLIHPGQVLRLPEG